MHGEPREEDVGSDEHIGLRARELDDLQKGRKDYGPLPLGKLGSRTIEVSSYSLEPESHEGAMDFFVGFEVGEGEVQEEVEEGAGGDMGGEGGEEGD